MSNHKMITRSKDKQENNSYINSSDNNSDNNDEWDDNDEDYDYDYDDIDDQGNIKHLIDDSEIKLSEYQS